MPYRVPFVDAKAHYWRIKPEIDEAIGSCLSQGDLVYRQQLRDFEERFAEFIGCKYAVGLNSGYHALHFSLLAAGVGEGDEVITAAHTFVATVSAIVHCGARPILVEVAKDYNLDPDRFEEAITPRTRAVIPVHLNGRVCEMDRVMDIAERHNLAVIEDAAQAIGAKHGGQNAGSFGLAGCFSFYPFKVLGACGDGGAITTNDPEVAAMISRLRYNGEDRETGEYYHHGYTALLDNIQAAVLDVKLRHLPNWLEHRRHIAGLYRKGLQDIEGLELPHFSEENNHDIFQNYVLRIQQRDSLEQHLRENSVETLVHWRKPMWEHAALGLENPGLTETESICREVLSLPMSAETTPEQVEICTEIVREFFVKVRS